MSDDGGPCCIRLTGYGGLLGTLVRDLVNAGLETEMAAHLGYRRHRGVGPGTGNARNGSYHRTIATDVGPVEILVPRDRAGTFVAMTVPRHSRRLPGVGGDMIRLLSQGEATVALATQVETMYGADVDPLRLSRLSVALVDHVRAWQRSSISPRWSVLLLDVLDVPPRRPAPARDLVLVAVGVDPTGAPAVLSLWAAQPQSVAAGWAAVLADLCARGLGEVDLLCCDGSEAVVATSTASWPEAALRTDVTDLVLNDLRPKPEEVVGVGALLQSQQPASGTRAARVDGASAR